MILCDTNILIDLYKNDARMIRELQLVKEHNIAISAITAGELIYGARNKRELAVLIKDIKHLNTLPVNEAISKLHLELLKEYSLSHDLRIPDALIAATAIQFAIPLFTLNIKDFHYMDGLELYQPSWVL